MEKLIILNHKMNLEYNYVYDYIDKLNKIDTANNIVVCPSNIYLESFINNCSWGVGAQDVDYRENGSYTGAISTLQLKSLGIEYVLLGHYERKKYFSEDNKIVNKKLRACLESNIIPILCFGSLGNREGIVKDLEELLAEVEKINFIVFAYEPLALEEMKDFAELKEDINFIYDYLLKKYKVIPNIVYGGGVVLGNVAKVFNIDKLNGILIGELSIEVDEVSSIVKNVN